MLDPDAAENFLEDMSSGSGGERDAWSPVGKMDHFFEKAETAMGESNNKVANFFGRIKRRLMCWKHEDGPESKRKVILNDEHANRQFRTNFVSTAKYNLLNAFPKFLYEQFVLRIANSYFLFVGILYCIDSISPVLGFSRYGQLIAVAFIITVSMIKEIVEDSRRHIEDRRINRLQTTVLGPKGVVQWGNVKVGDIVKICKNEPIPADVALLHAQGETGLAFVETKQLDGESNLKVKSTVGDLNQLFAEEENAVKVEGFIESEAPNERLQEYFGSITVVSESAENGKQANTYPLTIDNLLVRGCRLRQTPYVYGTVVNTGLDTKLMRNMKPKPKKVSTTESKVNFLLVFPVCLQIIIITTLTSLNAATCSNKAGMWFLSLDTACTSLDNFLRFFTFFCTFANLVPISLYVSIEVIRGIQVYFINGDNHCVDYERDEPVRLEARTSNLTDEMGILTHLFSDKTGTLTANDMVFKKCFVANKIYEECKTDSPRYGALNIDDMRMRIMKAKDELPHLRERVSKDIEELIEFREFNYLLSMCHSVVVDNGAYQASSPDEAALVLTGKNNGFEFKNRSNKSIFLNVLGVDEEWDLLGSIEFNSKRKRMSVIVRSPHSKKIYVYCKGADMMIFSRVREDMKPEIARSKQALDKFAYDGLRTLCLGYKEISEEFFASWSERWAQAQTAEDREARCESLSDEMESGLILVGCTAIEDRLQDGVPDTLRDMERANIKVWVLTGDKQETAINIGLSCGVLDDGMDVIVINEATIEDAEAQLDKAFGRWSYMLKDGKDTRDFGLVIDGGTLEFVLHKPETEKKLVILGRLCKTVIGCRTSPKQKADVVEMVRRHEPKAITMAVGDGANDVAMIQAAHVGVGIVGVEGLEAKLVSDFSIGQFRFLRRLVLVHGRWCYKRIVRVICYIMYKNLLLVTNDFYFAFHNSFSGQPLVDPWITAAYNVLVSSMPIVAVGAYDADVKASYALEFPEIYRRTQARTALRITVFIKWVLSGLWQGTAIFWLTRLVLGDMLISPNGQVSGLYAYGVIIFTQVVVVAHAALITYQSSWNSVLVFVTAISLSMWFWIGPLLSTRAVAFDLGLTITLLGVVPTVFRNPYMWLTLFLNVTICVFPGHVAKYIERNYRPTTKTLVQELMRKGLTRRDVFGEEQVSIAEEDQQMPTFSRRDMEMEVTSYAFDGLADNTVGNQPSRAYLPVKEELERGRRNSDSALEEISEIRREPKPGHRRVHTASAVNVDFTGDGQR